MPDPAEATENKDKAQEQTPDKVPESKEQQQTQEQKADSELSTPQYFDMPTISGETRPVTQKELLELAQYGEHVLTHPDAIKAKSELQSDSESESQGDSDEDKYDKLNKEFQAMKKERKDEKTQTDTLRILDTETGKYDVIKEHPKMTASVKREALSIQTLNPRLSLAESVKMVIADRQEQHKEVLEKADAKGKANSKVANAMGGIVRGGGGLPNIDTEKKFTAKDIKDGTSQKLMEELLEGLKE